METRRFWVGDNMVSTVGGNKEGIGKYIIKQEHEGQIYDQIALNW